MGTAMRKTGWRARAVRHGAFPCAVLMAVVLTACSRKPQPAPATGAGPLRPTGVAADSSLGLRLDLRVEGELARLAARGLLGASLCRQPDSTWVLDPGTPVRGLRIAWRVAEPDSAAIRPSGVVTPWNRIASPEGVIEREVAAVLEALDREGHPLASVTLVGFAVDSLLTAHLEVDPGPPVRAARLGFEGNRVTRQSYMERVVGWKGVRPYRSDDWRVARLRLLDTGLFDAVEGPLFVRMPEPAVQAADSLAATADSLASAEDSLASAADSLASAADSLDLEFLYRVRERSVNRVGGVLGYSGNEGKLFGFLDLELGNLFGTGRRARLLWQGQSQGQTRFELGWHEPYVLGVPIELDLFLNHAIEDTLYAESNWGFDLRWGPAPAWKVRLGWGWSRLVLSGDENSRRNRQSLSVGVRRSMPGAPMLGHGWRIEANLTGVTERAGPGLLEGWWRSQEWTGWRGFGLWMEQQAALVAGPDSLLLSDALRLGGATSLRGTFDGAYRATRYVVQRTEIGPRPRSPAASRVYALLDLAWLREWEPTGTGLYGTSGAHLFLWSAGVGVRTPSRLGDVLLDYAVPGGEPVWQGRIHFGIVSRF